MYFIFLPLIFIVLVGIAITALLLNRKRKLITSFDIQNPDVETILASPVRPTILSVTMILFGSMFCFFEINMSNRPIDFRSSITYISVAFLIIALVFIVLGVRLFLRRNNIVQLQFERTRLKYLDTNWKPRNGRNGRTVLSLFYAKKFLSLEYAGIKEVNIEKSWAAGDTIIIITKNGNKIFLPFLPESKQQMSDMLNLIKSKMPAGNS